MAEVLINDIKKSLPPDLLEARRRIISVNKVTRLLETTYRIATEHQKQRKLGFIRKAVLANNIKWGLKESGYPSDFIDVVIEGLVIALSQKN